MLTVTLKWGTFLYFTFLKVFKHYVSLVYFKAKNEEKLKKTILLLPGQKNFPFLWLKNLQKMYLKFSFWQMFFHVKGNYLQISKKYSFLRSL